MNKICKSCNIEFEHSNPRTFYCSDECRKGVYICKICNEKFLRTGCTCNIDENDEIYKYIDKSINNLVDNALYHIYKFLNF